MLLTVGMATYTHARPGVYWAQSDVIFLAPISVRYPNSLTASSGSLISTAGVVERLANANNKAIAAVSATVTLVDKGITSGEMVQLNNYGGQWAYNFSQPALNVQVVGDDPFALRDTMATLQSRIQQTLKNVQDLAGVDQYNRITTYISPAVTDIEYRQGNPKRALIVTSVVGLAMTIAAIVALDIRNNPKRKIRGKARHARRPQRRYRQAVSIKPHASPRGRLDPRDRVHA
jgi:hypothetical protein